MATVEVNPAEGERVVAEDRQYLIHSWSKHGGTHGSPVSPLLHSSVRPAQLGLSPGKARLRPRTAVLSPTEGTS